MSVAYHLQTIDADGSKRYNLRTVMSKFFHVDESTISRYLGDPDLLARRFDFNQIAALACHLCDEWGDTRLSNAFCGNSHHIIPRSEAKVNGYIDDDVCELQRYVGQTIDHYKGKRKGLAIASHNNAKVALENFGAEIMQMP